MWVAMLSTQAILVSLLFTDTCMQIWIEIYNNNIIMIKSSQYVRPFLAH